jgi:2-amino-4-hydroxy-6-hydroxymethyldihydropteridine diphosphokinase
MTEGLHEVYLGLGSNLGDRRWNIAEALRLIGERVGQVVQQSSLIETEPWGFLSENGFLNGVVCCLTEKTPREVLRLTQQIERDLGKQSQHATRRSQMADGKSSKCNYHDRPIDIDILLYDDLTVDEPDLKIPHPLMHERDFVMTPLREIIN